MPNYQRASDENATWIQKMGRFPLGDLAILIALIVWIATPHPDTEARAMIAANTARIEKVDAYKVDRVQHTADQALVVARLDDIRARMERLENKMDQIKK